MNLIIPDKFRGTLSAAEAARAIALGLGGDCLCLPMADGGEGTAEALPHRHVVESAATIGHKCDQTRLNIMYRSSHTLGIAIRETLNLHDGTICVAVGGTVTADGGAGLLQALGVHFYDSRGRQIVEPLSPAIIPDVAHADIAATLRHDLRKRLLLLSDVEASLTHGPLSALDFLPQKGATAAEAAEIRRSLEHLHSVLGGQSPFDGAGGGAGYAIAAVLGCRAQLGAEFILSQLPVDWSQIHLVATGEGCIDRQSLGGKVVGCVLRRCSLFGIPAVAFGGKVSAEVTDPRCIQVTPPGHALPTPGQASRFLTDAARKWAIIQE